MKKWQFKKSFILYAAELLVILVLVLCGLFGREECVLQATSENIRGALSEENGQTLWHSEDLQLKSGVYRIVIDGNIPADAYLTVSLEARETKVFREILANATAMYSGQTRLEQRATVTAGLEAAYLRIVLYGNGAEIDFGNVSMYRTSQLYLVLAVCALILMTIVNLLLYLRRLIVEKRISGEQQTVLWVLVATVLLSLFPHLTDYLIVGENTRFYLDRVEEARHGLAEENLWLMLPACLRMVGFTVQESYRLFLAAMNIATTVIAYHCFRQCVGDRKVALAGTIFYVLEPYRLYTCYNRGAIGECLTAAFAPLVVCGILLLLKRKPSKRNRRFYVLELLAGLICLLQSFLLSAELPGETAGVMGSPVLSTFLAFVRVLCVLAICFLIGRCKAESTRNGLVLFLMILAMGAAVYQVNDIAFYMPSTYLYNMGSEVTASAGGMNSGLQLAVNVVSLCAILIMLGLGGFTFWKRQKGGVNRG